MAGTIALSGSAIGKAGTNVATVAPASLWDEWIEEAEGYLSDLLKFDIVANWTSLNTVKRQVFTEYASRYAAMEGIKWDPAGYTSLIEAEDLIQVHIYRLEQIEKLLKGQDKQDFMGV